MQAWQPEGADALLSWHDSDEYPSPLLEATGGDAEFVTSELQEAIPMLDAVDVMNAIAQAATHEELAAWAERLGLFARGERDPAVESVIFGLINSGNLRFQHAVLQGLRVAQWPCLAEVVRDARRTGSLAAELVPEAQTIEDRLSSMDSCRAR